MGILRLQYNDAVKSRGVVWRYLYCSEITDPLAESRRINEEMDTFDIPPSFGISENQEMGMFVFFHFVKLSIP